MKEMFTDRTPSKITRTEDCRAAEVCNKMKNVRRMCEKGGSFSSRDIDVCLVSVILLLDKLVEES
jgi:hypothetical protein